ncbi:hypothetical protein VTI74DRAFT_6588 [Chaetomium olivicolor]
MKRFGAILVLACCISGLCSAQKQCFFPNGQQAANDFPCDPNAADSPCCGGSVGGVCLTNKLCRSPDGNTIRGSCTDKSWNSPECPQYCLGANTGGTDLISCANVTNTDTSFCCDHHRPFCCDEGVARFDVFPSKPEVLARWDAKVTQYVAVQRTSSSASSQASTTGIASSVSTTSGPSATSTPTSGASAQSQSASPTLSTAAKAGIGAGAGVLAIALAAIGFLLYKLHKRKAQLVEMEKAHASHGPAPTYGADGNKIGNPSWYQYSAAEVPRQELETRVPTYELPSTPGRSYYR